MFLSKRTHTPYRHTYSETPHLRRLLAHRQKAGRVGEILGGALAGGPFRRLRVHNFQALQRRESHTGRRAGDLLLDGGAAAPNLLLLLQVLLQRLADAHLGLLVDLGQSDAAGAGFADGAARVAEILLVRVLVDLWEKMLDELFGR